MTRFVGTAAALVAAVGLSAAGLAALTLAPTPAEARVVVGIGVPGFYPAPYPYYPPPAYYPPPPPAYYPPPPPPAYYPPPAAAAPSASEGSSAGITYTSKPGWTNAEGEPCREYKTTQMVDGRATTAYGTACRDASGTWRVAE